MAYVVILLHNMNENKKSRSKPNLPSSIYNDRDLNQNTIVKSKSANDLDYFQEKHKLFEKYKVGHTLATGMPITRNIWRSKEMLTSWL